MTNEGPMTLDDLAAMVSQGFSDLQGQITGLRVDVSGLKTGVAVLKADVAVLKTDMTTLRAEVGDLKGQVGGLRHEVTGLRVELTAFRSEVDRRFEGMTNRFDRHERDLADIKYLLTDAVRRGEFLDLKQRVEVVERRLGLGPRDGP